jgi:hypothetical protein
MSSRISPAALKTAGFAKGKEQSCSLYIHYYRTNFTGFTHAISMRRVGIDELRSGAYFEILAVH